MDGFRHFEDRFCATSHTEQGARLLRKDCMKSELIADFMAAVDLFRDRRKARTERAALEENRIVQFPIPAIECGAGFYDTVEGATLSHCERYIVIAAQMAFQELPPAQKRRLSFSPKDGEFTARAQLWKELLGSVLPPELAGKAMQRILHWYIHIKQMQADQMPAQTNYTRCLYRAQRKEG